MANRIAGITVEIGGDTTKLSTALKSVNQEIRSTQSALNDVNRLLKLDPGNTELLTQKHKLLAQAVSETREKLQQLKDAATQANEKLANGEITQGQYDALQREIVATEEKLKSLEEQADKSAVSLQKLAATGENMKKLGENISNVGGTLTKTVTTPIVALGTAAVKTAADFDSAMAQVQAVSGATGNDFESLREKAREMGSKTKFSATEAAEAMNYMAMAGWKTTDMLDGIEGIMNLAAASGEDLATTSDIVTDALTAFGLTAGDSGHFADILAAASSNANTNVSMMGETFKYCAPIAGALGFSAEDTGFLFLDKEGMPLVALHWEHRFKSMLGRYNEIYKVQMPKITPHVCRHTYCSNMAKSGMNPKTLQYLMGHSDIGVTLNVYTHVGLEDAEKELQKMQGLENARKEMGISDKEDKPLKQNMFKVV